MDKQFKMIGWEASFEDGIVVGFEQETEAHKRKVWVELDEADLEASARTKLNNLVVDALKPITGWELKALHAEWSARRNQDGEAKQ